MDSASGSPTDKRKELILQYADGPEHLRSAWNEVPTDARLYRIDSASWSAKEIVCHCADSEMSAAIRLRMLAAEVEPTIIGYDQDVWARVFNYHDLDAELALTVIPAVRAWTVPVLQQLSDEQWEARGNHSESGPYSTMDWLHTYSVHLHDHAEQIRTTLREWTARTSKES